MKPIFIGKDDSKNCMYILASAVNMKHSPLLSSKEVGSPDLMTENGLYDLKTTNDQYYRKRKHIDFVSMSANLRRHYKENKVGYTSTKSPKKKKSKRNKISKQSRKNNR